MPLRWVKFSEYRRNANPRCCLCAKPGFSDEWVLMNTALIPHPWICYVCAEDVAYLLENPEEII